MRQENGMRERCGTRERVDALLIQGPLPCSKPHVCLVIIPHTAQYTIAFFHSSGLGRRDREPHIA